MNYNEMLLECLQNMDRESDSTIEHFEKGLSDVKFLMEHLVVLGLCFTIHLQTR